MRNILTLSLSILALCGCQNNGETGVFNPNNVTTEISLRATSELLSENKIAAASFAPKEFASWTGQILLLSESGQIHTSNTGFGNANKVSDGPFTDILGLSRGDDPSVFIALTASGDLKAFQEDESGDNFKSFPLSSDGQKYAGFCDMEAPSGDNIYAISDQGHIIQQPYVVNNNDVLEPAAANQVIKGPVSNCAVDEMGRIFYAGKNKRLFVFHNGTSTKISAPGAIDQVNVLSLPDQTFTLFLKPSGTDDLYLWQNDTLSRLIITPGLSIGGIDSPAWAQTTHASMGNTFNKGLTLIGDQDSSRIVMISNEYLMRELSKPSD